ncbi:MAG: hypothetical protein AAB258_01455 [Planctomycetota bacterium]
MPNCNAKRETKSSDLTITFVVAIVRIFVQERFVKQINLVLTEFDG